LEEPPRGLGQGGDVRFEAIVDNDVECGNQFAIAATRQNSGERRKAFGPTDMAIAMHIEDRLLIGVDAGTDEA
jgi:hypothetical protein